MSRFHALQQAQMAAAFMHLARFKFYGKNTDATPPGGPRFMKIEGKSLGHGLSLKARKQARKAGE